LLVVPQKRATSEPWQPENDIVILLFEEGVDFGVGQRAFEKRGVGAGEF
jgi:hypothetical protein